MTDKTSERLQSCLKALKAATSQDEMEAQVVRIFQDTTIDFEFKTEVAKEICLSRRYMASGIKNRNYQRFAIACQWAGSNFEAELLRMLVRLVPLKEITEAILENPNLNWTVVSRAIISDHSNDPELLRQLVNAVKIHKGDTVTAIRMMREAPYLYRIDSKIIYDKVRSILDLDESVPVSWIAKALGIEEQAED